MDFTREPVIETVVTPREGCKLVVRSSKSASQEEYFVDAVEVVSFGSAFFYRSLEKPKCFLLPVIDYEILEVREARMVLKHVGSDKSIKIGGGRKEKEDKKEAKNEQEEKPAKKRERRRQQRRRRTPKSEEHQPEKVELPKPSEDIGDIDSPAQDEPTSNIIRSLLSPPPLISETIKKYRESYSQAFYEKGEDEEDEESPQKESFEVEQDEKPQEEVLNDTQNELVSKEEELILESEEPKKESILKDLWNFSDDR